MLNGPNAMHFDAARARLELPKLQAQRAAAADIAGVSQAVVNGTAVGNVPHGIVSIWGYVPKYEEWRQICTGTLLTNHFVVTARHCFEEPDVAPELTIVTLDDQGRVAIAGEFAPDAMDVALLLLDSPVVMDNATSGYSRPVVNPSSGLEVFAVGYGHSATTSVASNICRSGTKGCPDDRRNLRYSQHTTFWDWSRQSFKQELGVSANAQGQYPFFGDSGGPILQALFTAQALSTRALFGVTSGGYYDEGVWQSFATPVTYFRNWMCGYVGC